MGTGITYFDTIALNNTIWTYHYCIIPRKCIKSEKWMWLTKAVLGLRTIPAALAGEHDYIEKFYMDPKEFTMWRLTSK